MSRAKVFAWDIFGVGVEVWWFSIGIGIGGGTLTVGRAARGN